MYPQWLTPLAWTAAGSVLALAAEGAIGVSAAEKVSVFHRIAGTAVALPSLLVAMMLRRRAGLLSSVLALTTLLAVGLGGLSELPALKQAGGIAHAMASHALFAALAVAAVEGKPRVAGGVRVEDAGWPPLRSLAWVAPATIFLQIGLGTAYRHQVLSVVPHITGAFVAAVIVLMAGSFLLTLEGANRTLRRWAGALISVLLVQLLLGAGAYFAKVAGHGWMVALTVTHVVVGSVLLALSCVLSAQIFRDVVTVRPVAAVREFAGSSRNG